MAEMVGHHHRARDLPVDFERVGMVTFANKVMRRKIDVRFLDRLLDGSGTVYEKQGGRRRAKFFLFSGMKQNALVRRHILRGRVLKEIGERLVIFLSQLLQRIVLLLQFLLPFLGDLKTVDADKIGLGIPVLRLLSQVAITLPEQTRWVVNDELLGEESERNAFLKQRSCGDWNEGLESNSQDQHPYR